MTGRPEGSSAHELPEQFGQTTSDHNAILTADATTPPTEAPEVEPPTNTAPRPDAATPALDSSAEEPQSAEHGGAESDIPVSPYLATLSAKGSTTPVPPSHPASVTPPPQTTARRYSVPAWRAEQSARSVPVATQHPHTADAQGSPAYAPRPPLTPRKPSRGLARSALITSLIGLFFVLFEGTRGFGGLLLLIAAVLGVIALIRHRSRAAVLGGSTLGIVVVGWILAAALSAGTSLSSGPLSPFAANVDDYAASGTSGWSGHEPPAGVAPPLELELIETGFGQEDAGDEAWWWFAVVVDNPNSDFIYRFARIDVEAYDEAGELIGRGMTSLSILPGVNAISDLFEVEEPDAVASLIVHLPPPADAAYYPGEALGGLIVSELRVEHRPRSVSVEGAIISTFANELDMARVTVIARDREGAIIAQSMDFPFDLRRNREVAYQALFFSDLPEEVTFEVYASR